MIQKVCSAQIQKLFANFWDRNAACRSCEGLGYFVEGHDSHGYPFTSKCIKCRGKGYKPRQMDLFDGTS